MKRKLKGITVPYLYYNKGKNYTCYIYRDKEYTDLNELFLDFLGTYLTYHYMVGEKLHEVHNLSDVLDGLLKNKKNFSIPIEYRTEYSESEYDYIIKLQEKLVKEKLKIENKQSYLDEFKFNDWKNYKLYKFNKEVFSKYKGVTKPKRIHSDIFGRDYYVVAGLAYESIYRALDEVFDDNLYYQFGGTKSKNNRSHFHSHSFDDLISLVFERSREFKIHTTQQQYYSRQEIEFLNILADKLRSMKFKSISRNLTETDVDEYFYLKDNRKIFGLLAYNIRSFINEKKYEEEVLKSHKI